MKLRTQVHLIVASLSAAFLLATVWLQFAGARESVREETAAANVVATRLLGQIAATYADSGEESLLVFLQQLGRIRAHEIWLLAPNGRQVYRSPPSPYKAEQNAPRWFSALLVPETPAHSFGLKNGAILIIEANASRAVLDGWEDLRGALTYGSLTVAVLNVLVFWLVGRAVKPWTLIANGLERVGRGDLTYRLPPMSGYEADAIARAFNRMAPAVEEKIAAEGKARDAEARLQERRELDYLMEQRLDEERRAIARELHDEFAQSLTAIRSLAVVIATQSGSRSPAGETAHLISTEAARLSDAMHSLIPRLAPVALDTLGLADALEGLVREWQERHPLLSFSLRNELTVELGASITLAVHRVVQESVINVVRHAKSRRVDIEVTSDGLQVRVRVADDGIGLPADWSRAGRFGLRGLRERVAKLGGALHLNNQATGGLEVIAEIPLIAQEVVQGGMPA